MDNKTKTELILAARSGDYEATKHLIRDGINPDEIFLINDSEENERSTEDNYNYIFVVKDTAWDDSTIEMVTSNFQKAFEYAYKYSYELNVWVDGAMTELIRVNVDNDLQSAFYVFTNEVNSSHTKLSESVLPLIIEKKNIFEEEKRKEEQEKADKLKQKELKELARLRAKYESE